MIQYPEFFDMNSAKFFQAVYEENYSELNDLCSNELISPWKFYESGGYTGIVLFN